MPDRGWVKAFRKLDEWEWYRSSETFHLFLHLILHANHDQKYWQGIAIERGQLVTSREKLSEQTGISQQSIRTCLNRLKSTNEITIKSTNRFTIITVCKYSDYQFNNGNYQPTDQPANQQTINQQSTSNQPQTRIKELKKKRIVVLTPDELRFCQFFREKTGRQFDDSTIIEWARKRTNNGNTLRDCALVVVAKVRDWKDDPKWKKFLRPSTLFNSEKFPSYLAEVADIQAEENANEPGIEPGTDPDTGNDD